MHDLHDLVQAVVILLDDLADAHPRPQVRVAGLVGAPRLVDIALLLGGDRQRQLAFRYLSCSLFDLDWQNYRDSDNLVARLNLPNMRYRGADRVAVYAWAVRGLLALDRTPRSD